MARYIVVLLTISIYHGLINASSFYDNPEQDPIPLADYPPSSAEDLRRKWDSDWPFSGISTFAHLKHVRCLSDREAFFDVGIIGAPFDTAVSYRPGARFGPRAIRAASARQIPFRGFNPRRGLNPYSTPITILDCGDIPITPVDNAVALHQMTAAFLELGSRSPALSDPTWPRPKLLTLGGDHSVALASLRALHKIYQQPIAVLHFDAHLDTWHPAKYPSAWISEQSKFTHGTMFWMASNEGLILNGSSAHAGLRTRLSGDDWEDFADDEQQGFLRITADEIDEIGTSGIIDVILERIGTKVPVYLSLDIDVLDPGITALVASQVGYELLTSMVGRGLKEMGKEDEFDKGSIKNIGKKREEL
ncbi:MAG: hypothetical protein Q9191_000940 [Dirinaria sp. TL-2023a]